MTRPPFTQINLDDGQDGWVRVSPSTAGLYIRLKIKGQASKLLTVRETAHLCQALLNECDRINQTQSARRFPTTSTTTEKECQA